MAHFLGQPLACLHISGGALNHAALACGFKEGLDGPDDLATSGPGFYELAELLRMHYRFAGHETNSKRGNQTNRGPHAQVYC